MSASREKATRREQRAEQEQQVKTPQKKQLGYIARQRRQRIINSVVAVVVVLALIITVFSSTLLYKHNNAVRIGDDKYTVTEFNYYYSNAYNNTYNNLLSSYGEEYISYFIDTNSRLDKQTYIGDASLTWDDYFTQTAIATMEEVTILYNEAVKAGYSLDAEQQAELQEGIDAIAATAESYGVSEKQFLKAAYGKGMNMEIYAEQFTRSYTAYAYAEDVLNGFEYSADELEAHYAADPSAFDTVSFRSFYLSGAADDEAGIDSATAMSNALNQAEAMVSASSAEVFADLAYEYAPEDSKETYEDEDATLSKNLTLASVSSAPFGEWLFEDGRSYGDTTVVKSGTGYYAVLFESREDTRYELVNVRHILIAPTEDAETGEISTAAWTEANKTATSILESWQSGDATEDSFAELANAQSADSDGTDGGLYENVYKGQMVPEFEAWCFDEARQPGDTGIVKTDYGYHIMYFVGTGDNYWESSVDAAMRNADYAEWYAAASEGVETKEYGLGMLFAGNIQ